MPEFPVVDLSTPRSDAQVALLAAVMLRRASAPTVTEALHYADQFLTWLQQHG